MTREPSYSVHRVDVSSVPLAVIRRTVRASELSRVVPECCGLVWNVLKAQQARGGRHVAVYLDDSMRVEVGAELLGPFREQYGVVVPRPRPASWPRRRIPSLIRTDVFYAIAPQGAAER